MPRAEQAVLEYRTYALPPDFPLIVLTGDEWHISPVPSTRLHIHNCLEIGLCHSESGTMVQGARQVDFSAGCVTCVSRNVPHTTWSDQGTSSRWSYLFLDPAALFGSNDFNLTPSQREEYHRMLADCHFVLSPAEHPWARPLVEEALLEYQRQEEGYQNCIRCLLLTLIIRLHRLYQEKSEEERAAERTDARSFSLISPAVDYMHERFDAPISIESLAEMCHISVSHFRRLFHQQMGVSPLRFLQELRVVESCQQLRATGLSIAEVALQVGYPSLSSFNQHFREIMGCTPSQWRKSGADSRPILQTYEGWQRAE